MKRRRGKIIDGNDYSGPIFFISLRHNSGDGKEQLLRRHRVLSARNSAN